MKRKSNDTTTRHYRGHPDYKSAFSAAVSELIATNRANPIPRHERMRIIGALTDEYVTSTGERPDAAELERLADAVLYEELTDMSVWKAKHAEYPFFSEVQKERRTSKDDREEAASLEASDGKCYRKPTRRRRSPRENAFMDRTVKSRNKARRETYRRNTRPGEIITYNMREVTTTADIYAL